MADAPTTAATPRDRQPPHLMQCHVARHESDATRRARHAAAARAERDRVPASSAGGDDLDDA